VGMSAGVAARTVILTGVLLVELIRIYPWADEGTDGNSLDDPAHHMLSTRNSEYQDVWLELVSRP
jgi:hypothetical protein